jgi:hypothetical protein
MVFKSIRGPAFYTDATWAFSMAALYVTQDHPAHIPRRHNEHLAGDGTRPVRAGSRLAPVFWPECPQRHPWIKHDFAGCTLARHFPRVLVVLRSQSCLRLEGRTRTLSGPSRI